MDNKGEEKAFDEDLYDLIRQVFSIQGDRMYWRLENIPMKRARVADVINGPGLSIQPTTIILVIRL